MELEDGGDDTAGGKRFDRGVVSYNYYYFARSQDRL